MLCLHSSFRLTLLSRTHRERKDQYAQELEWRVLRAKEAYVQIVREKEELKHEVREMAQLLQANGIPFRSSYVPKSSVIKTESTYTGSSTGSFSGTPSSRAQTVDSSPYEAPRSLNSPNRALDRSPHSPGKTMAFRSNSPATSSNNPPQSPMNQGGFGSQAPIGVAITTDHKASSTGSVPQIKEPPWIFRDDQISLDFVLQYVTRSRLTSPLRVQTGAALTMETLVSKAYAKITRR